MEQKIDFENLAEKLEIALLSDDYKLLVEKFTKAKKIYLMGNGGLNSIASHMSSDMTRLIPNKCAIAFSDPGFISSIANDYSWETVFVRHLETMCEGIENPSETLLIGLSCSGNSKNVVNALKWGEAHGFQTFQISGVKSTTLPENIGELSSDCIYFHTAELLTTAICYDLIIKTGNRCPEINAENARKGYSVSSEK